MKNATRDSFQRWRPTRQTFVAFAGLLSALTFGAVRDFVWRDLREGLISLRGLAWTTRFLILLGFGLLLTMLGALLFSDAWRANADLLALSTDLNTVGRGALLPTALAPLTLLLLAVAWSFALAGVLHALPLLRIIVLLLYELTAATWLSLALGQGLSGMLNAGALGLALALLAAIPLFFAARWRAPAQPPGEFAFLLLTSATTLAAAHALTAADQSGIPLDIVTLESNLGFLGGFITPLLLLIGVEIADFAREAATWTTELITLRLPRAATLFALLGLVVWRAQQVFAEVVQRVQLNGWQAEWSQYLGAFGEVCLIGVIWLLVKRLDPTGAELNARKIGQALARVSLPLILFYSGVALVTFVLLDFAAALPQVGIGLPLQEDLVRIASRMEQLLSDPWHLLIIVLASLAGGVLARRGQAAPGLYLAMFGAVNLWGYLTTPGNALSLVSWYGPEPLDFGLVVILLLFALSWVIRRQLTAVRVGSLIFLLLLTLLLRQTDFIANRFSPFLSVAGVGFIAFGVAWDALTAGSWTNQGTPGLPRTSRILLYLGYILLTVTLVNWALTSHNLTMLGQLTGEIAISGLNGLGRPLLYTVFAVTLATPHPTGSVLPAAEALETKSDERAWP
ncbi:MAG: hypothetical protein WCF84_12675 [Anaerolineae bacterium]